VVRLIRAQDGTPAAESSVRLALAGNSAEDGQDSGDGGVEDGVYTIDRVAAGVYTLEIELDGYDVFEIGPIAVAGNVTGVDAQLVKTGTDAPEYTVSGVIGTSDEGSPLWARVELRKAGATTGKVTNAGTNGAYAISGVTAGWYSIEASLEGYDTGVIAAFSVTGDAPDKNLTLAKQSVPEGPVYTVSGTIATGDGGSANGARVQLRREDGSPVGAVVTAGEGGVYTISGVAAGSYTIEASIDGYESGTTGVFTVAADVTDKNLTLQKTAAPPLGSAPGSGTQGADEEEPEGTDPPEDTDSSGPPYYVTGMVAIGDSQPPTPAVGATVTLRKSGETSTFGLAITNNNGFYSIDLTGIPAYYYYAKASMPNWPAAESNQEFYIDDSKNITGKDLRFHPTVYTLNGKVTTDIPGGAAVGAKVELEAKGGSTLATTTTDSNGNYAFYNVAKAQGHGVRAFKDGYKDYYSGAVIGPDTDTFNIPLEVSRYRVEGAVYAGGTGAYQAAVVLKRNGTVVGTESAMYDTGYYGFEDVPAGTYTIEASFPGYVTGVIQNVVVSESLSEPLSIYSTSPYRKIAVGNLTLAVAYYTVSGTISLSGGGYASGASVQLKQSGTAVGSPVYADGGGAYTITGVGVGTYTIDVSLAGYATGSIPSFGMSSANVTGKNLTLMPTYSVSGTISLSDSGNLAGAWVQLKKNDTTAGSPVAVGSDGVYTITGVSSGTYTIDVFLAGYVTGSIYSFQVSNANVTGKNLTLIKEAEPDDTSTKVTGKTLSAALDWIKEQNSGGEYTIELGQDESGVANYDIRGFTTPVTITVDGKNKTVAWINGNDMYVGCLALSDSGVTVILKNVTFTGATGSNSYKQSLVRVEDGATLRMEAGATLTGNQAYYGGAVYVASGGTFEMTGGSITGNYASTNGGGVFVTAKGRMIMSGGSITGNKYSNDDNTVNDVTVRSNGTAVTSLTMSADARIGRVWLTSTTTLGSVLGSIIIDGILNGSDIVATIDLLTISNTAPVGKQILQGSGASNARSRFTLGVRRASDLSKTGTDISGTHYIDSGGYIRAN
jgi:hypothetical protein